MGEVTMDSNGFLSKISSLFNNPLYSDVQFVFMNKDVKCETIYCHKLILALQSKIFASQFFDKETSPNVMKMQASKKHLFHLLFQFIYTGDVSFHSFKEAKDLHELASDYAVEELIKKCHNYILQDKLAIENIFSRYEHALERRLDVLLKDCRDFVCANVKIVLESDEFANASFEVVNDIVKLDNLPLSTEFEIIKAVLNWGLESLKKNEVLNNGSNLRSSIDPFLKHLRILSLTPSEFRELVRDYEIFSGFESMTLFQELMMPNSSGGLPENFCCITSKRGTTAINGRTSADYQQHNLVRSNSSNFVPSSYSLKSVQSDQGTTIINNRTSVEHQQYNSVKSNSSNSVRSSYSTKSVLSDPPKTRQSDNNKITFEVKKCSPNNGNVSFSGSKQKFNSSPNILDIDFPAPNFSQNLLRDFLFPLEEIEVPESSFWFSFRKDLTSSVIMKLKSGNLSLHGFELKVKHTSEEKKHLQFFIYVEGFSKQPFETNYNIDPQKDIHFVKFPKPMKLIEGSNGKLEVSVNHLSFDHCSFISKRHYELNTGLNFECEFRINSDCRKGSEEYFPFLINKLIYVPY